MNKVYTGSYKNCKAGNLISISKDRGKSANFEGKVLLELAPKPDFWRTWRENIGKISEEENTRFYIEEYYKQVLSKVDIEDLLKDEENPILLCYEDSNEFCHRHVVASYIEIVYGVRVDEIEINSKMEIKINSRDESIKEILLEVMNKNKVKKLGPKD